jgi:hypothetical protein
MKKIYILSAFILTLFCFAQLLAGSETIIAHDKEGDVELFLKTIETNRVKNIITPEQLKALKKILIDLKLSIKTFNEKLKALDDEADLTTFNLPNSFELSNLLISEKKHLIAEKRSKINEANTAIAKILTQKQISDLKDLIPRKGKTNDPS